MTNFDFLTSDSQFDAFSSVAVSAEKILHIDPSAAVINCRRAMEFAVKWMYSVDGSLVMPYQDTLVSLMNTQEFKDLVGTDIYRRMDFIRRMGNNTAHTGKKISEEQGMLCLENLFVSWTLWLAVTARWGRMCGNMTALCLPSRRKPFRTTASPSTLSSCWRRMPPSRPN